MMFSRCSTRVASNLMLQTSRRVMIRTSPVQQPAQQQQQQQLRRWMTAEVKKEATKGATKEGAATSAAAAAAAPTKVVAEKESTGWWSSAKFWGGLGALAGWGMSGAAIYDASQQGPEVISMTMTPVLIVYSTLFARWAWVVQPRNLLLMYCHIANVAAQVNQLRRALQHKLDNGQEQEVHDMVQKIGIGGAATAVAVAAGPRVRTALSSATTLGFVSTIAAADAGPFTVHFWAPMSKWFISGASFMELYRPTDQISLPQYTALTATGFFFSRYALLVTPINYTLCSVNIALFVSSAWHLGRKIKADFIDSDDEVQQEDPKSGESAKKE